jgi:hypothetical protein
LKIGAALVAGVVGAEGAQKTRPVLAGRVKW